MLIFLNKKQKNVKKGLQKNKKCDIIFLFGIGTKNRGIAQLVEYRSPKPWVAGSNPPAPAKQNNTKPIGLVFFCFTAVLCDEEPHRILPKGKITVGLALSPIYNSPQTIAQVGVLNPPRDTALPIIPTVPTVPFATASKKHQRPQSLVFCGRSFICLHRRNF